MTAIITAKVFFFFFFKRIASNT